MQEDTHYHNYHFTVESGYTTSLSNICRQNIDGDQDSIFHCPQDEHSSENRFRHMPILDPSQSVQLVSIYLVSNRKSFSKSVQKLY